MPKINDIKNKLLFGLTGRNGKQVLKKIDDAEALEIKNPALFLEMINPKDRINIYERLKESEFEEIPLVHIKNDMQKWELEILTKQFGAKYLTIHESSFEYLSKWRGNHKKLFLEMNYDNYIPKIVQIEKISGFCIDLSHFKASEERATKEFEYAMQFRKQKHYFKCNHINGYSYNGKKDIHRIRDLSEFEYLKTLPEFIFGKAIAIETFNKISEQSEFRKHIAKMLSK